LQKWTWFCLYENSFCLCKLGIICQLLSFNSFFKLLAHCLRNMNVEFHWVRELSHLLDSWQQDFDLSQRYFLKKVNDLAHVILHKDANRLDFVWLFSNSVWAQTFSQVIWFKFYCGDRATAFKLMNITSGTFVLNLQLNQWSSTRTISPPLASVAHIWGII